MDEDQKEMRESTQLQMKILRKEILPAMGFTNIRHQIGYEADDHIATPVMQDGPFNGMPSKRKTAFPEERKNNDRPPFLIVSADEDLFQLLDYADQYSPTTNSLLMCSSH